jgi:hypothetical protein
MGRQPVLRSSRTLFRGALGSKKKTATPSEHHRMLSPAGRTITVLAGKQLGPALGSLPPLEDVPWKRRVLRAKTKPGCLQSFASVLLAAKQPGAVRHPTPQGGGARALRSIERPSSPLAGLWVLDTREATLLGARTVVVRMRRVASRSSQADMRCRFRASRASTSSNAPPMTANSCSSCRRRWPKSSAGGWQARPDTPISNKGIPARIRKQPPSLRAMLAGGRGRGQAIRRRKR